MPTNNNQAPAMLQPVPVRVQEWIDEAAQLTGLEPRLIQTIMQKESGYNPFPPDGGMGEIGPMQLMPDTVRYFNLSEQQARDPRLNVLFGARWLRKKIDDNNGNVWRGVVAYNGAGPPAEAYGIDARNLYHSGGGERRVEPTVDESAQQRPMTVTEFAARARSMLSDPEDRKKRDDVLVREVLEQYPELMSRLQTPSGAEGPAERRPGAPQIPTGIMTPPPPTPWQSLWEGIASTGRGLYSPERTESLLTRGTPYAGKTLEQMQQLAERPITSAEAPAVVRRNLGAQGTRITTAPTGGTLGDVGWSRFVPSMFAEAADPISGFTSPQAIATAPLVAAGRLPGAIGNVARGIVSGQGLAYTLGGLGQMYGGVSQGVTTPGGAREFLSGAAAIPYGEYLGRRFGSMAPEEVLQDVDTRLQGLTGNLLSRTPSFRVHMQEITGAGREPVEKALSEAKTYNEEQVRQHRENELNKMTAYQEKLQKYLQDKAEGKQGNVKELRDSKKAWMDAQRAHSLANQQNARIARDEQAVGTRMRDYVRRGMDNVYRTYRAGQGDFDYRWADLRERIRTRLGGPKYIGGRPNPRYGGLNSELIHGVIERETLGLAGSPENVQAFKQLTNFMTAEGGEVQIDAAQGGEPALRDIQWHEGLRYHNVIDRAIRSPSTAGAVRNALQTVQAEAIEPELARVAGVARVDRIYSQLNRDYSQWLTDWSDPGAVSTGASPLRDAVERKDPLTFLQDVTKGIGEDVEGPGHRMVKDFAKYRKYGADPSLLAGIQKLAEDAKKIKTVNIPPPPGMYQAPTPKELPVRPTFEPPKPPELRQVDPVQIRREILRAYAGRPMIPSEVGRIRHPLYRFYKNVLKSPSVRERIARQPRQEIQP